MTTTIFEAAEALLRQLRAPAGAVNVIAQSRATPPSIRLLIDPVYWHTVDQVPDQFEGYPVTAEKREPNLALRH